MPVPAVAITEIGHVYFFRENIIISSYEITTNLDTLIENTFNRMSVTLGGVVRILIYEEKPLLQVIFGLECG